MVRPFFNGFCKNDPRPSHGAGEHPPAELGQLPCAMAPALDQDNDSSDGTGVPAAASRTSNPSEGHGSSCSTSSFGRSSTSDRKMPARPQHQHLHCKSEQQDQPKVACGQSDVAVTSNGHQNCPHLKHTTKRDVGEPRDLEDQNSDTSSMVVLARTKKHRQSQEGGGNQVYDSTFVGPADDDGDIQAADSLDKKKLAEHPIVDLPPAAAVAAGANHRLQPPSPAPAQLEQPPVEDDEEAAEGNASSSSSERNLQENAHGYNVPHIVTESASNTNTTTSGSGSAGNSGSNQGSSGSGNGSSGSGNGSSGSGNEGKGSSEDVGTKEDNGADVNSNSEDAINSDDRNGNPHHHGEGIVANKKEPNILARRHAHADICAEERSGANHHHHAHAINLEVANPSNIKQSEVDAERVERKKRKRMNMRREYEEKVQHEMDSSESSDTKGVCLRPGRPITLDKVLSFTKLPRFVNCLLSTMTYL